MNVIAAIQLALFICVHH